METKNCTKQMTNFYKVGLKFKNNCFIKAGVSGGCNQNLIAID